MTKLIFELKLQKRKIFNYIKNYKYYFYFNFLNNHYNFYS